jgi:hypothetical protein
LDRGDIDELGRLYAALASVVDLRVIGGCCGTDHEHVATPFVLISAEIRPGPIASDARSASNARARGEPGVR